MTERWAAIGGYGGAYEVSDAGVVRSYRTNKGFPRGASGLASEPHLLGQRLHHGYPTVLLTRDDGSRSSPFVHGLVAEAFIGPKPNGQQVNHRDGVKTHNAVTNLEYVSPRENRVHAIVTGLAPVGERHHRAKLTTEQVEEIRRRYRPERGARVALAREFRITSEYVSVIVHGRAWSHLPSDPRAQRSATARLTREQVAEIRAAPRERGAARRLADRFGVSRSAIRHVLSGRCWREAEVGPTREEVACNG